MAAVVAATLASRWALLGRDDTASGYDAWYYVLQVRSLADGVDLFGDDSWAFPLLGLAAAVTGDVVLGNELVAAGSAAAVAGLLCAAGLRLGGWSGGLVAGAWAAASTGHLSLSAEFLKNAVGAVPLAACAWLLTHDRRSSWALALFAAAVAAQVHKLSGALALGLWAVCVGARLASRAPRTLWWAAPMGAVVVVGLASVGVLGPDDLARRMSWAGPADRWAGLSRLPGVEAAEMGLAMTSPALAAAAWWRGQPGPLMTGLAALGLVCAAPGLPFSFDELSWRLLVMGFVPLALALAALKPSPAVALAASAALVAVGATNVESHGRRGPDYGAWEAHLATIRDAVPPDHRLVAHRGLCGFLWAEGGRRCTNFEPEPPLDEVWRVVYGFSAASLDGYGEPVPLPSGYLLLPEEDWQAFRAAKGDAYPLAFDPRNPYRPAPVYVRQALQP